jgi:hypothetical protein
MESNPYNQAPPPVAPTNSMAVVSLITGILGLTLLPFLGSIVALVTGNMARNEMRRSPYPVSGEGLATAGLVLGWVGVGLGVLSACGIGFVFLCPALLALVSYSADMGGGLIFGLLGLLG